MTEERTLSLIGESPSDESTRASNLRWMTNSLPPFPGDEEKPWCWREDETAMLRAACRVRFDESVRTETLFTIAATAIRIYLGRYIPVMGDAVKAPETVVQPQGAANKVESSRPPSPDHVRSEISVLKPCPFCGEAPELIMKKGVEVLGGLGKNKEVPFRYIKCDACDFGGSYTWWQDRAPIVPVSSEISDNDINLKAALALTKKYLDMIVGHKTKYTLSDKEVTELRETHYLIRDYLHDKARPKPVSLALAERAMLEVPPEDEDGYKTYKSQAEACAKAWGLSYAD